MKSTTSLKRIMELKLGAAALSLERQRLIQMRGRRRRMARGGGAWWLVAFVAAGVGVPAVVSGVPCDGPQVQPPTPPVPMPGNARSWEAQVQVSTFSAWNTRSGNILTTIPIVSLSRTGPDLSMALYHNSGSVTSTHSPSAGSGIDLGPGWTTSYSSHIVLDDPEAPTTATVIADDGTPIEFTWRDTVWGSLSG